MPVPGSEETAYWLPTSSGGLQLPMIPIPEDKILFCILCEHYTCTGCTNKLAGKHPCKSKKISLYKIGRQNFNDTV